MQSTATPILELRALKKAYNIGTPIEAEVLHGIDLTIDEPIPRHRSSTSSNNCDKNI